VHSFAGLLSDPDARIRLHAVNALGEIGGDDAIPYLLQARYDSHSKIRANAAAILQEMGVAEID
jgi:HEAT repeat protein